MIRDCSARLRTVAIVDQLDKTGRYTVQAAFSRNLAPGDPNMFTDNSSTSANALGPVLPEDMRCSLKLLINTMDATPTNSLCDEQSACSL